MVKKSLIWVYRATLTLLWLTIIVLTCSVLLLRYVVLPKVDDYKDQIAQKASEVAGQKITIGDIDASWDGLNPHFALFNVELSYGGVFRVTGFPQEHMLPLLFIECPRLLFPFARQIVADATRNGGFPPLMIDPIDFAQMFTQRMAEEQVKAKVQAN